MATSQPFTLIGTAASSTWGRQAIGRFLALLVTHTTGADARSGVVGASGDPLKVVAGGGARDLIVKAGAAVLATTSTLGPLPVVIPTQLTVTCDPADGVNPRKDLVILEVDDIGTADSVGNVRIVKGIPASNPQVPSTNWLDPSNPVARPLHNGGWFALGSALVPASSGSGAVTTITDLRPKTAAAGGVIAVPGAYATPSLAADLPPDTVVVDTAAAGGPKLLIRDSGTGLTRSDVPPVGMRRYGKTGLVIPTATPYDLGVLTTPESSFGTAYVGVHANGHDLVVTSSGLYRIDVEVYMENSVTNTFVSLKVDDVVVQTAGVDGQGRVNFGRTGSFSANQRINVAIQHAAGSDRTFSAALTVTRLA